MESLVAMVGVVAVRPAGARAGSEVLRTATALQQWRSDRVDKGICSSVSRLRETWLQRGWPCALSLGEEVCSQRGLAAN